MSVKNKMDKTMTALEDTKTKIVKTYKFINGLSVRNKAGFDLSVKSDKYALPIWRHGFSYTKEIKVMPIILCLAAGLLAVCTAIKIGNHCDK